MFEKDEDYRKARKESKDRITKVIKAWCAREEVIHDKGFEQGAEFGYYKANEWHFDEAPDNENDILCQIAKDESVVGYYSESKKRYFTIDGQNIDVIAWKEIVLPKEIAE